MEFTLFQEGGLWALAQVLMIDVVLAGDNAVVIGLAAARVPLAMRKKVILWGLIAAVVLRIAMAAVAVQLLAIIGLMLAGGILLLWVCWRMWRDLAGDKHHIAPEIETGATVTWEFADFPGAFPVKVVEAQKDRRIVLAWEATDSEPAPDGRSGPYDTRVTMTFEPLEDGRTLVSITEEGWRPTEAGQKSSYGNCMGWSQMLVHMKAYVEHGLNLREGMYV